MEDEFGRVHAPDRQPVDAELPRRLVHHRLEDRHELVLAGSALRTDGRRVGEHGHRAPTHRIGLIDHRERIAGGAEVAAADMRAVLLHDVEVGGDELAVLAEAELDVALEARTRAADAVFLHAGDAVHHRPVDLLRHQRGDRHVGIAGDLAAEAAAAELGDEDEVVRLDADQAGDVGHRRGVALVRAVEDALAALPTGEGGARLHAVVRVARGDEAFLDDELRRLEAGVDVAVGPLLRRLAERHLVVARGGEVAGIPFHRLQVDLGGRDIAVRARIGAAGEQAFQRIGDVGKLLEVDLDRFDRLRRDLFRLGGHREDRLADIEGLVLDEDRRLRRREARHVVGGEDAEHALDLEGGRGVDAADAGVRDRARQRLAERHAVGTEVFRIFGAAGDLGDHIDRSEVLANEIVRHLKPPVMRA